jgi:hypothetical protein
MRVSRQCDTLVLNAGPDPAYCRAWDARKAGDYKDEPAFQLNLRSGEQRIVSGGLIRVRIIKEKYIFAAVAWTFINK